jgi:hypothetical protein
VLTIDLSPSQRGSQPCNIFGLHPKHTTLRQLWLERDASLTANIGSLVQPITKQEYVDKAGRLPAGLFAHNLMTQGAHTLLPQSSTGSSV